MKEFEPIKEITGQPYYPYGMIGTFDGIHKPAGAMKYTIVQSLWTKPITDQKRLRDTLYIAALSLAFAHSSGYKVNMHTDSRGAELMKNFGYDRLLTTLDKIPATVPTELFAAGKFFAMRAEGYWGKVHVDVDVLLKQAGILDKFYEDKRIDVIAQMDEDMSVINHDDIISTMHLIGYPFSTRPNWQGSLNTGVVGFNNRKLAYKYFNNYAEALKMYTVEKFEKFKKSYKKDCLNFDFVLEQINLSYMSVGYNVQTLVPTHNPNEVADRIGYQHLQGSGKWTATSMANIKDMLADLDMKLYRMVNSASHKLLT